MFDKCIKCTRLGDSCVPNLMLLTFHDLMEWCIKRQKYLEWKNQTWADESNVPVGTINRLKAGEYDDCKFSTIRSLAIAVIGGTKDEFSCTEQVEKELQQKEKLEQQTARLSVIEVENEMLKKRLAEIDEIHRKDIRIIKDEYMEQIAFLKEQLRAWQSRV